MSIFRTIGNGFTSDNPIERGAWTGGTAAGIVGGGSLILEIARRGAGKGGGGGLPALARATVTAGLTVGALGAISGVRLSEDRFVGGFQGAGIGAAVGGAATAMVTSIWAPQVLKNVKQLAGIGLIGAGIGGALYATIGLTGVAAKH